MRYYAFGFALGLAAFLAVNATLSMLVAALASLGLRAVPADRPSLRARLLLGLRLLPSLAALVFVLGAFAPAYALFEPRDAREVVTPKIGALAALAALVIAEGLTRGVASWLATHRLVRGWLREARLACLAGAPVAAYRVRDAFPVVSVVGLVRPRIFLAEQVLDALTPGELEVAVAHEAAHVRSHDNLKRLLFRSCPDLLAFLPAGRALEREWARAAEMVADSRVAAGSASKALDLGAALVKVARLAPPFAAPLPASALHDGGEVSVRVRRLLAGVPDSGTTGLGAVPLVAATLLAALAVAVVPALPWVHRLTEAAALLLR